MEARYLLGTGVVSSLFNQTGNAGKIVHRLGPESFAVSVITLHEATYSLASTPRLDDKIGDAVEGFFADITILPVNGEVALEATKIRRRLKGSYLTLGLYDLLILATARHYNLAFITSAAQEDVQMLKLVEGLAVEKW